MNSFTLDWFQIPRSAALGVLILFTPAFATAQAADPQYYFSHIAGPLGGPGSADGPPLIGRLNYPVNIAIDAAGFFYVTDRDNRTIRKISPSGQISTLGGAAGTGATVQIYSPSGVAVDATGNAYVSDDNLDIVYKISPGGIVTTLAGMRYDHYYSSQGVRLGINRDGTGTDARFSAPSGLAVDTSGNVYVADRENHTIRKITPGGVVTTLAGAPGSAGVADGTGTAARFQFPRSVAVDSAGILYVADAKTIRRISPGGIVTTLAGPAGPIDSGLGPGAAGPALNNPQLAVDASGNLYVADTHNHLIRKITPSGILTTLAGTAAQRGSADGIGSAARFDTPWGVAVDRVGSVFVADSGNDCIRKVSPIGVVTTFAGTAGGYGTADGTGASARFNQPWGVSIDDTGNLFVADRGNKMIRRIAPSGEVTTLANSVAGLREPTGVAAAQDGTVFFVDAQTNTIREIARDGVVTLLAGKPFGFGRVDGPGATAMFAYPLGIAINSGGTIYVTDGGNKTIRVISPEGIVSTIAIQSSGVELAQPNGIALNAAGNLIVADRSSSTIRMITPTGIMTILAGIPFQLGHVDGPAATARFSGPCGVAVDSRDNIFVADTGSNTIRMITPAGVVSTVGGTPQIYGSADGVGSGAHFFAPNGIDIDRSGNLYISEEWNHSIRKGVLAGPPVIITQPLSQTVPPGANVQFSVAAAAVPAPTYQWFFNGGAFSGATTDTLSFANARASDVGDYTVVVTNELGSVTSNKATLTVSATAAPSPADPAAPGGGSISAWIALLLLFLGGVRSGEGLRQARSQSRSGNQADALHQL